MTFSTGLDRPVCNRLKSPLELATEKYDRKVLRRVRVKNSTVPSVRKKPQVGVPLPPQTPGTPRDILARNRDVENQPRRASFTNTVKESTSKQVPSSLHHRPVKDWLHDSVTVAAQALENTTFTHDLRKKSHGMKREADKIATKSRIDTNTELRNKVKDVQKVKERVEVSLSDLQREYHTLGQVRQFIIEIKSMLESGAITGCEMRQNLRISRPESERTFDKVDKLLSQELAHHKASSDKIDTMVSQSQAHMEKMTGIVTHLFSDLEDKVEGLRINEQCLVLDGSSSKNTHMGGSAAHQPPLDIILDSKAKEIIQGLYEEVPPIDPHRPNTLDVIAESKEAVLDSLSLRKSFKKQLMNLDIEGRKINKSVKEALVFKVKQQRKLLATLEKRIVCIVEEREKLESQMETVRGGLNAKNKEKDIVCKRLRLRRQIPTRETFDKVHDALEAEYDVLTHAVQDYTNKLSQIILEISRMHDTYKTLEDTCIMKRTSIALDQQVLDLPFIHEMPWLQNLYNGICSGESFVYGVV